MCSHFSDGVKCGGRPRRAGRRSRPWMKNSETILMSAFFGSRGSVRQLLGLEHLKKS